MSKIVKYAVLMVVLVIALVLAASAVLAKSPRRPYRYESYMATCVEYPPEEVIVDGSVMRINVVVTTGRTYGDPYVAGEFENHFDVKLNTETGKGWVRGTTVIKPDAYDGVWQGGRFSGRIGNDVFSGRGFEIGSGELEGLVDLVRIQDIPPSELPEEWADPCQGDPVLGATLGQGKIIERYFRR